MDLEKTEDLVCKEHVVFHVGTISSPAIRTKILGLVSMVVPGLVYHLHT